MTYKQKFWSSTLPILPYEVMKNLLAQILKKNQGKPIEFGIKPFKRHID